VSERRAGPSIEALQGQIGSVLGVSDWFVLDQKRIDGFAENTGDTYFIHTDPERAGGTAFGGTIAHGFLSLSMLPVMIEAATGWPETEVTVNYGLDRLRFLAPVRSGKRVRGSFVLADLAEKRPGQWLQRVAVTVEIEGEDKPALVADWLFLHTL
jgi:acyl dehydratase